MVEIMDVHIQTGLK